MSSGGKRPGAGRPKGKMSKKVVTKLLEIERRKMLQQFEYYMWINTLLRHYAQNKGFIPR